MMPASNICVLTVDLEEWFHGLEPDRQQWRSLERRTHISTSILLDILDEFGSKATFFVLGDVAETTPELIREVAFRGHEIGTHGMHHQFVYHVTPEEFRQDLRQSIRLLESITSEPVLSYRAPYFSVTKRSMWALEILEEEGIKYDSSIFPARNPRYGISSAERTPHKIGADLWEWPITTIPSPFGNIPFSGGAYFRFLPFRFIMHSLSKIEKMKEPLMFYFHPWEIDQEQPYRSSGKWFNDFTHYYRLKHTEEKLKILLSLVQFTALASGLKALTGEAEYRSN